MKTFLGWAETEKKELPMFEPIKESTKRQLISYWAYPSASARAQYPDAYFLPYAADAMFKMQKKPNDKA